MEKLSFVTILRDTEQSSRKRCRMYVYFFKYIIILIVFFTLGCAKDIVIDSDIEGDKVLQNNWWVIFEDEQLNSIISTAVKYNGDSVTQRINVIKAMYNAKISKVDMFPKLSAHSSIDMSKDMHYKGGAISTYSHEALISYEIDVWRRLSDVYLSGMLEYYASNENYIFFETTLINNIIDSYFYISYLQTVISILEKEIKVYSQLFDMQNIKYVNGKIPRVELLKIEQDYVEAKKTQILYIQEYEQMKQILKNYLNTDDNYFNALVFKNIFHHKLVKIDRNIILSELSKRPDVKSAEYKLMKCFYDVEVAKKALYPSLSVDFNISYSSQDLKNSLSIPLYLANVKINLPFLDWYNLNLKIKVSKLEYEIAKNEYRSALNEAINEAVTAFSLYTNSLVEYEHSKRQCDVTQKKEQYNATRYSVGSEDASELLYSKIQRFNTEIDTARNYYEVLKYSALTFKAQGGGKGDDTQ